jgi:hypothetical protein
MKKIAFIQSFNINQKAGGAVIINKLIESSRKNGFDSYLLVDENEVPSEFQNKVHEKTYFFKRLSTKKGPILRHLNYLRLYFNFDKTGSNSITTILEKINPDIIHIVAHGEAFPLYLNAAKKFSRAQIRISVHDLWPLTISNRFPKFLHNYVFNEGLKAASVVFPISDEMAIYLNEKYKVICTQPVYDAFEYHPQPARESINEKIKILYAGNLNPEQKTLLKELISSLDNTQKDKFEFVICSNDKIEFSEPNNSVLNLGWVNPVELQKIAETCDYGIMALSFEVKSQLFNQTSFMTKVPFYLNMRLPIIYVGPQNTSAAHFIKKNDVGILFENLQPSAFSNFVIDFHKGASKKQLTSNIENCLMREFNIDTISKRFYKS